MYYYIKGIFVTRGENYAVIENNGIGYKVYSSNPAIEKLAQTTGETTLFTHLYVREDVMDLYGFPTNEELTMFLKLLSVSGVGPKAALSILSVASPAQFALAVITNDVKIITKATGVGPKLAQRVILELKDKLKTMDALDIDPQPITGDSDMYQEALSALIVLGYSPQEAKKALSAITEDSVEMMVKEALKQLMR